MVSSCAAASRKKTGPSAAPISDYHMLIESRLYCKRSFYCIKDSALAKICRGDSCNLPALIFGLHDQAVEELNIKPKYWKDLMDDTPFTRKDIIHLQDPLNLEVSVI